MSKTACRGYVSAEQRAAARYPRLRPTNVFPSGGFLQQDKFAEWMDEFGIFNLVAAMQCHQETIKSWKTRENLPTAVNMRQLIRLAKGAVSYADIIDPFFRANPELEK
jgi:hypothetical protein